MFVNVSALVYCISIALNMLQSPLNDLWMDFTVYFYWLFFLNLLSGYILLGNIIITYGTVGIVSSQYFDNLIFTHGYISLLKIEN